MRIPLPRRAWRLSAPCALLLLSGVSGAHPACAREPGVRTVPVARTVDLAHEGVVARFDIRVKEHEIYNFGIRFRYPENDQAERARIRKIIGGHELDWNGQPREPGVPTPVRITITSKAGGSNPVVYRKELTPVLTSWGGDPYARGSATFTKALGHCDLVPGEYTVVLESLAHPEEYASIPTYVSVGGNGFKISFDPRHADRSRTCPQ